MSETCTFIIDVGSCTNIVSQRVMKKLSITTVPRAKSHKLQQSSEKGRSYCCEPTSTCIIFY